MWQPQDQPPHRHEASPPTPRFQQTFLALTRTRADPIDGPEFRSISGMSLELYLLGLKLTRARFLTSSAAIRGSASAVNIVYFYTITVRFPEGQTTSFSEAVKPDPLSPNNES